MEIQGTILTIQHGPVLAKKVKELTSLINGFQWEIRHLKEENAKLEDQVKHYQHLILLEGKERKKLSKQRAKTTKMRTRKGWVQPNEP
jgi:FtsZ-binding cell division protein ZapB